MHPKEILHQCKDCIHCSAWNESQVYGECERYSEVVHLTEPAFCPTFKGEESNTNEEN